MIFGRMEIKKNILMDFLLKSLRVTHLLGNETGYIIGGQFFGEQLRCGEETLYLNDMQKRKDPRSNRAKVCNEFVQATKLGHIHFSLAITITTTTTTND